MQAKCFWIGTSVSLSIASAFRTEASRLKSSDCKRKSKRLDFRLELQVVKEAHLLFKVIDQRYKDNKSLIFTTNIEEPDWPEFLGDIISTEAILDRIFHHSVIVRIQGYDNSYVM
jgi:hypothetical protein